LVVIDARAVDVATRDVFSEEEQEQLRGFPEINRAELIRHFTLTGADVAFLRKLGCEEHRNGIQRQASCPWTPWNGEPARQQIRFA
jgi:Domain of unknown function (DUF4158)